MGKPWLAYGLPLARKNLKNLTAYIYFFRKNIVWHDLCCILGVSRVWVILIGLLCLVQPVSARKHRPVVPDSLQRLEILVHGIPFTMQRVEGGSFMMGATQDQYDNGYGRVSSSARVRRKLCKFHERDLCAET